MRRVAITGIGVVSALGVGLEPFRRGLREGRSAIRPVSFAGRDELQVHVGAEVADYDPLDHFDAKRLQLLDRFAQFAVVAAREAVRDAALPATTAVVLGTGVGGRTSDDDAYRKLYGDGNPRVHPLTIPRVMAGGAVSHVTMDLGLKGPAFGVTSACASANHAIIQAFQMVRSGAVEAALTGGSEACFTLGTWKAWESMRVMASDTCRPFSLGRKGMVLGEGAGVLLLEPLEAARARGATIYAELAGGGMSADAGHIVEPSAEGAAAAMRAALEDAGLAPEQVGYINAHGTGTAANDATETRAIRAAFGVHADRLAVSSTKSMHGHALGASGALELAATAMALWEEIIPPTANYLERDPGCDLDCVPNDARAAAVEAALSNSFAFGGLNAVVAIKRA